MFRRDRYFILSFNLVIYSAHTALRTTHLIVHTFQGCVVFFRQNSVIPDPRNDGVLMETFNIRTEDIVFSIDLIPQNISKQLFMTIIIHGYYHSRNTMVPSISPSTLPF